MPSRAPTKSVNTVSTWSSPANTAMMSELGFVYFLVRTAEKKLVRVYAISIRIDIYISQPPLGMSPTSSACKSAAPKVPGFRQATARKKSCRVWGWRCIKSSGPKSLSMFTNETRSGFKRKNSRQKPSGLSASESTSSWLLTGVSALVEELCWRQV
jgi:hypothetical protein